MMHHNDGPFSGSNLYTFLLNRKNVIITISKTKHVQKQPKNTSKNLSIFNPTRN